MTATASATDLDTFRRLVESRLGLRFDDSAVARLEQVLGKRMAATALPLERYLRLLAEDDAEPVRLARELTVGETYFLRHVEQFRAFAERVVPERLPQTGGRLRVLSAGCSTGEEAYSLAIVLRDVAPAAQVSITGVDLNTVSLETARRGRYTSWSLRAVAPDIRRRWFTTRGTEVRLHESIREAVGFEWANLAAGEPSALFRPGTYDTVFCRNVVMYFAPDVMARVVSRLAEALAPGGYLFLGSAETLRGMSNGLELCESHGTFYYRRPGSGAQLVPGEAWYDSIKTSLDRVQQLTAVPVPEQRPQLQPKRPKEPQSPELAGVLALIGAEHYADALAALSTRHAGDVPDVLLLRATALTHLGRYRAAEQTCHRLLGSGEYLACAHLLLALGREAEGDIELALDHCRAAAQADPEFALPHVHLARLARRRGDLEQAVAAAVEAVRLLAGETDVRIMLFGGGFDRQALIALARVQSGDLT